MGDLENKKQQVFLQMLLKRKSWLVMAAIFLVGTISYTKVPRYWAAVASAAILTAKNMWCSVDGLLRAAPCNYAHDGYYFRESNTIMEQVYQTLLELDDDDIPVVIECGGHDGISKTLSLNPSVCFHMNTFLIEANPSN